MMNTLLCLTLLTTSVLLSSVTTRVSHTRMEVARCRAQCLHTLREDSASCWSACEDLDTCHRGSEDRGRQVACDWLDQANRVANRREGEAKRIKVWELASPLDLDTSSCRLSWGKVRASSNSFRSSSRPAGPRSPPVYVLVAGNATGEMWELSQTNTRQQDLVPGMFPDTVSLRLVVVGAEGVRLTSSLDTRDLRCSSHQFLPVVTQSVMEDDLLRVSVTWDNNDVEENTEYVVRWREYSLEERRYLVSVMGTLLVRDTKAQVTLRPDTGYILQVENSRTGEVSQSVIIDTRHAAEDLNSVAVILLVTTMVLVTLVMVALITVYIYRQHPKKQEAVKLNNNKIDRCMDPRRVHFNLDYNNLC